MEFSKTWCFSKHSVFRETQVFLKIVTKCWSFLKTAVKCVKTTVKYLKTAVKYLKTAVKYFTAVL